MMIFMAGGVSGNLKPFWKETCKGMEQGKLFTQAEEDAMRIFLAGGESRHWIQDELLEPQKKNEMRVYIAGIQGKRKGFVIEDSRRMGCRYSSLELLRGEVGGYDETIKEYHPYILESFYYCDADTERLLPYFGDFLLDSGAFTFMQGNGGSTNWNEYIERYADFINRNRIGKYFELDIDVVVGYEKVKDFRRQLERLTGKPAIPVWHLTRGLDEFRRMCDEYNYVAVGGIVSGEIKANKYHAFPALIDEAHKRGAKIHGLGFTALDWLKKCHFDSVDSTAWTTGNRFGYAYYFDGHTMRKKDAPKGHRLGDSRRVALNNYTEWIKFQKYADKYL